MEDNLTAGPYRATLLWNSLIRTFRSEIPLARHRRYMKTYDDCFVASDAVEWLHQYLKKNPNFGTNVSRPQAVQLLQKLHKARVFEDVRGSKHNRGEFADSGRLFRLTLGSPAKSVRTPIALRNNLKLANLRRSPVAKTSPQPLKLDLNQMASLPELPDATSTLPECHFVAKPLSSSEVQEEWKTMTLLNLQKVLGIENLEEIMESHLVSATNIMHNCLYINKSGVVTNIDPKDQLPHWALSAMKCLAYWPDKIDENLPSYPGFEKDVFRVVKDYFCGLSTPLMTFEMYEVITNIFVKAGKQKKAQVSTMNLNYSTPVHLNNFKSVENLLMNLTNIYKPSSECQESSEGYSSSNILDLSPIAPVTDSIGLRHERISGELQPVTRYETAFGPDNRTVTRVFYADGIATDFNHCEGTQEEHTPIETHFAGSPPEEEAKQFSRRSSIRHSVHSLFRGHLSKDKKLRREKTISHRRSTGYNINDEKSYGCTVGVYKRTLSDTPVSRLSSLENSDSSRRNSSVSDKIISNNSESKPIPSPPSYDTLFPEYQENRGNLPVLDGAKKIDCKGAKKLKRKKSMSSASLHRHTQNNVLDSFDSARDDSRTSKDRSCDKKDIVSGRSLSMSDLGSTPPVENELQKQCLGKLTESEDSVFYDDTVDRIKRALQLVLLLIPPASRRRLHLLLRLMNKIAANEKLVLDESQPSRNLLLETFYRAILCSPDESEMDELLVIQLVSFLMDHYMDIMTVPVDLKVSVEERLTKVQRTKIRYSSDDSASYHYCEQVTLEEYENQKMTASQQALATLLEEIVADSNMAAKDKRKRLKQFQKTYPEIYLRRFPSSQSESSLFPPKPKIKQPLFTRPLLKLKGLRL